MPRDAAQCALAASLAALARSTDLLVLPDSLFDAGSQAALRVPALLVRRGRFSDRSEGG